MSIASSGDRLSNLKSACTCSYEKATMGTEQYHFNKPIRASSCNSLLQSMPVNLKKPCQIEGICKNTTWRPCHNQLKNVSIQDEK